ncbi:MAG: class I SAM-dependent methyltransferase [Sedimentisphaerales bacterium]|nr:class I SAM-dependent methyltransferase [Sedimentisphaerales bacterium]
MECSVCHNKNLELININHAMFRHLDFTTFKESGRMGRCTGCQMLYNILSQKDIDQLDRLYCSREYAQSHQTSQTFIVEKYQKPVTRCFLQTELIIPHLHSPHPHILDIGCFDGALLSDFNSKLPQAQLFGYDVNENLKDFFPQKSNFHFRCGELADIPSGFDLICMSHSIILVRNLPNLMKQIKRLLKPKGLLFIQTPNITKNPCYILLADQYYCFTPVIMSNMLQHFGFKYIPLEQNWFARDIAVLTRLNGPATKSYHQDLDIYKSIETLDTMAIRLLELPGKNRIFVLGTTTNGAFVDSVLKDRLYGFVDENPNSIGKLFRFKNVIHPDTLAKNDTVIIPYGTSSPTIKERFSRHYQGIYMCM